MELDLVFHCSDFTIKLGYFSAVWFLDLDSDSALHIHSV